MLEDMETKEIRKMQLWAAQNEIKTEKRDYKRLKFATKGIMSLNEIK